MNILSAMTDKKLFGSWFRGESWRPWRAFLSALFALPFEDAEAFEIFKACTGRSVAPSAPFAEANPIIGRRGGKSLVLSLIVSYAAVFIDYSAVSVPGETLVALLLASDKKQAGILLRYIDAFFSEIPLLRQMVEARTAESIALKNGVTIQVGTSDYRAVRGSTCVIAACDELAFWPVGDSASPDKEVLDALRPAMSTIPGAILLGASSPYAQRGVLFENFKEHYGKDDAPILVWKAETRRMNPRVSRLVIGAAYLRDPASARAEYGAEFRTDVASFIPPEALQACIVTGRYELQPIIGKEYFTFTDPSGGASDSWPTATAHPEGDTMILDCLKEAQPPFSPENVVSDSAEMIKKFGCSETTGDHYAGEFPRELYAKRGVTYRVSEWTRSQIYLEFLPLVMSGRVRLLDNKKLISQLLGLERKTARGGKDSIDHGPGQHDDLANCVAGAVVLALGAGGGVLGVLEYEQLEASGRLGTLQTQDRNKDFLFQFEAKVRALQPMAPTRAWKEDPLPLCPNCKSTCTAKLSQTEYRCAECATQWFKAGHEPKPVRGQRGEYLAGRIPQARHSRFPGQR